MNKNIPVVWQLSALHLNKRTLFSGVLLTDVPDSFNNKNGVFMNFIKTIKSYFIRAYSNKEITITSNGETINTITDNKGSFRIITNSLHKGEIKINISSKDEPIKILQEYPIIFENTHSAIDVISDIDDTIIVSYTADLFKRISTLLFKTPNKREVIGFTQKMFDKFKKLDARVFYVSKSESNLFGFLTLFIEHNHLPKGVLFLTPYLRFCQLLNPKKGVNFKIENIRFLIENTSPKNYVLFGDDSQRDMEIYYNITKEFPHRILKIYIRQTKAKIVLNQKRMRENLKSLGVPIKHFKSDDDLDVSDELIKL